MRVQLFMPPSIRRRQRSPRGTEGPLRPSSGRFPALCLAASLLVGPAFSGCADATGPGPEPNGEPPPPPADLTDYRVTPLGTLGGETGWARGINDRNEVVGVSRNAEGELRAFLWRDDVMVELPGLGGGFSGAYDINDDGLIAGEAETAAGDVHPVLWVDGEPVDLGTLGGTYGQALAVNARGEVVGVAETAGGDLRPFRWWQGEMTELPLPPAAEQPFAAALGISARGEVVGTRAGDLGHAAQDALLWTGGQVAVLGSSCFEYAAVGINDDGLIVGGGLSCPISIEVVPLLWKDGGESEYLDPLGGLREPEGGEQNIGNASAVNAHGMIVGWSDAAPDVRERDLRATLWYGDGVFDLENGFAENSSASDINEAAVAAGHVGNVPALFIPGGGEAALLHRAASPLPGGGAHGRPARPVPPDPSLGARADAEWAVRLCRARGRLGPPPTASSLLAGCP